MKLFPGRLKVPLYPAISRMAMREVWSLQPKFNARFGSKPSRLLTHPRFRAGYDFLVLRAETGGADPELAEWWARYQAASEKEQRKMTQPPRNPANKKPGRKRSHRKNVKDSVAGKES